MSVLDIVLFPDEPLTRKADPYTEIGPEVARLARNMIETMHAADGVGLAGPQVGVARRIFVFQEPDGEPRCLVNPEILKMEGSEEGEEGCLSMPTVYSDRIPRATYVEVKGLDETGAPVHLEARNFLARILQHEYDHLDGILAVQRALDSKSFALLSQKEFLRS